MALNDPATWLLAYDIANPRRLGRVYRAVKKIAVPLQFSVWILRENGAGIARIKRELAALIDARHDDIRIYRIPMRPEMISFGTTLLPEDLLLSGVLPGAWA